MAARRRQHRGSSPGPDDAPGTDTDAATASDASAAGADSTTQRADYDCVVIGAGISGIATAKNMLTEGFSTAVFEATDHVGGLWQYTDDSYGVMSFTHINVCKYNYCFSDFPFPRDAADYPHNRTMAKYINDYVDHFNLRRHIQLRTGVDKVARRGDGTWVVTVRSLPDGEPRTVVARFVAVASGHHAKPNRPKLPGESDYAGRIMHAVAFKDAARSGADQRRVLVVGIGNSAVDAAVNCITQGRSQVTLSTRSGAWVVPNYIGGYPTDLYACRLFLWLPWRLQTTIFESVIKSASGSPWKWGLDPKQRAMQSQPTVSATLVHHIQRGDLAIRPDIERVGGGPEGKRVRFKDGTEGDFDLIVLCTGYHIDLPFLDDESRRKTLDPETNDIFLYKNVFSPSLGSSLAFIGFVQPASGGILAMSETQARWFAALCKGDGKVKLPSKEAMDKDIRAELKAVHDRYTGSRRHTIQRDPLTYCDEVAAFFGAKPSLWSWDILVKWRLAWRLLVGAGGAAQYRLVGPGRWAGAVDEVRRVPVTPLLSYGTMFVLLVLLAPGGWYLLRGILALLRSSSSSR